MAGKRRFPGLWRTLAPRELLGSTITETRLLLMLFGSMNQLHFCSDTTRGKRKHYHQMCFIKSQLALLSFFIAQSAGVPGGNAHKENDSFSYILMITDNIQKLLDGEEAELLG